ncbi:MAG: hypothetical protein FWF03_02700 [Defluviitaleaceae bacterium]|nr:hypothetical protein [Defluviitaleaceae bacterium]
MVEKMKFISVTGNESDMGRAIEKYLSRREIQFEYPARRLKLEEGLKPYSGVNPYSEALYKTDVFAEALGRNFTKNPGALASISGEEALKRVEEAYAAYEKRDVALHEIESKRDAISKYMGELNNFTSLDVDLRELESFKRIEYHFGKLPLQNFKQFEKFLYDDSEIIFLQSHGDSEYIWGVYFTPASKRDKVNPIFSSLHFERAAIDKPPDGDTLPMNPAAAMRYWQKELEGVEASIKSMAGHTLDGLPFGIDGLVEACARVRELHEVFDIRKFAAVTEKNEFIFVGWMPGDEADSLESEMAGDEIKFLSRFAETGGGEDENPPTKLKNPPLIRFFEFFTRMYGIPVYGEIDPTPVMAVTYTLLFGLMFGDVGQGLVVAALGIFVYKKYRTGFGGIIAAAGISGALFGFMYGSVFGFEEILPAIWRRPSEDINGTLVFAIVAGVCIIIISMLIHMTNALRLKQYGAFVFNPNGVAGFIFYGAVFYLVYRSAFEGMQLKNTDVMLACVPLVLVALREPIVKIIRREKKIKEGGAGMFVFSILMETVETLLTYATNTISFIRVGAFAVSHACIMGVVMTLSQTAAGTRNVLVIVVGNIVVLGIEGLLVGIQALRLDFYEVFSRFYKGGGQFFKPHRTGGGDSRAMPR